MRGFCVYSDQCENLFSSGKRHRSLRASSPFGGYREKYTRERHARGDATAGGGEEKGRACNHLS